MTAKLLQFGVQFGDGTVRASAKWATRAIFGYGSGANFGQYYSMTNLVSNTGVVSTDTTGVGSTRLGLAAAGFSANTSPAPSKMKFTNRFNAATVLAGTQKAIFG